MILACVPSEAHCQWESLNNEMPNDPVKYLYNDTSTGKLIVCGSFNMVGGLQADGIATWDGVSWDTLATGINTFSSPVFSVCRCNDTLYTEGKLGILDDPASVLKLTDAGWKSIGDLHSTASTLRCINNKLYAVGFFDSINGQPFDHIAAWDGAEWHSVGNNLGSIYLTDVAQYRDTLYVAGKFENGNGLSNVAKLVDDQWVAVANGISTWDGWVSNLEVFKGKLYLAGFFQDFEGNASSNIIAWDGTDWDPVGGGVTRYTGQGFIRNISNDGEYIYAAGIFDTAGVVPAWRIARWDGENWCSYDVEILGTPSILASYQEKLILGGAIYELDSTSIEFIAQADKYVSDCSTVGINELIEPVELTVYPNPTNSTVTVNLPAQNQQKEVRVNLYDVHGRLLEVPTVVNTENIEIDLSNSPTGMYFGQVVIEGNNPFGSAQGKFKVVRE